MAKNVRRNAILVDGEEMPKYWYAPVPGHDYYIVCEYNPKTGAYDINCRKVRISEISPRLATELKRAVNAAYRYEMEPSSASLPRGGRTSR